MLDIVCVVISKAEELLKLFYRGGFWPGTYGLNLIRVHTQTTSFKNVPQVLYQYLTKHFFCFTNNLLAHNFSKMSCKSYRYCSTEGLNTRMSSKYIVIQRISSENVKLVGYWKVAAALHIPMRMLRYSCRPYPVIEMVFG